MKIEMKKFGKMLISRPAGKDALSAAISYILSDQEKSIELDFAGVDVLAPSWADEFISKIYEKYQGKLSFINTQNSSVKATLAALTKYSPGLKNL